ncbi:hypothetical protein Gotur_000774 [Gossypium turneri]
MHSLPIRWAHHQTNVWLAVMPLQPESIQALLHEKAVIAIHCPHIRLAIPSGSLFSFSNFFPPSSSPSLSCHISDFLIHLLPQISCSSVRNPCLITSMKDEQLFYWSLEMENLSLLLAGIQIA